MNIYSYLTKEDKKEAIVTFWGLDILSYYNENMARKKSAKIKKTARF